MGKFLSLPIGKNIPFTSFHKISVVVSCIFIILSLVLFFAKGLNFGIDFKGGVNIDVRSLSKEVSVEEIRTKISDLGLGDMQVKKAGTDNDIIIRIEDQGKNNVLVEKKIRKALGDNYEFRQIKAVGSTVSSEQVYNGALAVLLSISAVLFYIWMRFEWQFGVGAVVALTHDVIIALGVLALLGIEFNLSIIAAILTIVGYSLNDTVVVYDRIRENMRKYKKMPFAELIDKSLNSTMSRTIMTSLTTLIALFSLYIFGGEVIRGFTFTMIWGVIIGTYSSIFIASPLLLYVNVTRNKES